MLRIIKIFWNYCKYKYFLKFKTRKHLEDWQDKQVKKLIKYAIKNSNFYRKIYQGLKIDNWQEYPLIDKSLMMENFDTLNTSGISADKAFYLAQRAEQSRDFFPTIGNITVGLSSGTSGNRGIFLLNPNERHIWAGAILAKTIPGSIFEKYKIAFFLRANSNVYTTINSRRILFEYFDLLDPLSSHIDRLNKYCPSVLVAPPSILRLLAEAKRNNLLEINPKKILSVAEVLDSLDEEYISSTFSQKIHQIYQCTEGFLAYTCQHGTIHLNEDMLVIQKEYVDKASRRFIPIITDFLRTTQPIIRYRLNDILTEKKESCPCGSLFTALDKIEGRCDDIFQFSSKGNKQPIGIFPDFISRAIIGASPLIEEYKVTQTSSNRLEVYLNIKEIAERKPAEVAIIMSFTELCNRFNVDLPDIIFKGNVPLNNGKKLKRVERLIK